MRFVFLIKADARSESGAAPSEELLAAMTKYNEELVNAGVLLVAEGLHPSSKGARVRWSTDGKITVIDGPFAEAKELIAGFWMIQAKSKEEAIEWVKRVPNPSNEEMEIEVRQVFDFDDVDDSIVADPRQQEAELRRRITAIRKPPPTNQESR